VSRCAPPVRAARPPLQLAGFGLLLVLLLLPLKAGAGGGTQVVLGFTNTTPIANADVYTYSTPYPSSIQVPPLPGVLQSISVTIYGLTDPDTSGIEMFLAGPEGTNGPTVDLMSSAGSGPVSGINITFSDDGNPFSSDTLTTGAYLPSGDTNSENLIPVPFPWYSPFALEGTIQLSGFAATPINVTNIWSLYEYYDDSAVSAGSISGGWSLQFTLLIPPSLQPFITNGPSLALTLSGSSGSSYSIQQSTNLSSPANWTTFTNLTLTNAVQTINAGLLTNQMQFFQAIQQ
jgi:hypothetical protein